MIDPVVSAVNVWLAFMDTLPVAITGIVYLALVLYVVPSIIKMFWSMR